MCLGCLVTSAILAFMPVSPPPQVSYAVQQQLAITAMVAKLPVTSTTRQLRQELLTLEQQLATTTDEQQARQLMRDRLSTVSAQIAAHPQSDLIWDTLDQMIANTEAQTADQTFSPKRPWGWLP